jgi:hypothetical protein
LIIDIEKVCNTLLKFFGLSKFSFVVDILFQSFLLCFCLFIFLIDWYLSQIFHRLNVNWNSIRDCFFWHFFQKIDQRWLFLNKSDHCRIFEYRRCDHFWLKIIHFHQLAEEDLEFLLNLMAKKSDCFWKRSYLMNDQRSDWHRDKRSKN